MLRWQGRSGAGGLGVVGGADLRGGWQLYVSIGVGCKLLCIYLLYT